MSGPKGALVGIVLQPASGAQLEQGGQIKLEGDASVLQTYGGVLDTFDPNFNIVTP